MPRFFSCYDCGVLFLKLSPNSTHRWTFYLTASLLFGSTVLRTLFLYRTSPALGPILALLGAWLALFIIEPAASRRWRRWFPLHLVLQTGIVCGLLLGPDFPEYDFFALLFAVQSMQAMQHFDVRSGAMWVGGFALLTALPLLVLNEPFEGLAMALPFIAADIFLAAYALATRRAQAAQAQAQSTAEALQAANRQLEARSAQLKQLAVVRARHHLARDLHDSVTQTIFSMTLTTQSALLILKRDPGGLRSQLDRLNELAQSALAEMYWLVSELSPGIAAEGGLPAALRRHLTERRLPEGLTVALEAEGSQRLEPAEEHGLFRIAQEALNNIVKHAQASQAHIRLHLAEPLWMEIEDQGRGFEARPAPPGSGVGLASMRERAAEIGWRFQVTTAPGAGTRVRVDKGSGGEPPC